MELNDLNSVILEYTDGDLIALSDIIDLISTIRSSRELAALSCSYFDLLLVHLNACMRRNQALNRACLAEAMDAVAMIENSRELSGNESGEFCELFEQWKLKHHSAFLADAAGQNNSATPSDDARLTKAEPAQNPFLTDDVFKVFLSEAAERIVRAQQCCLELEKNPADTSLCHELFRIFHTLKGECSFFKLASLGELTHSYENILDMVRNNELAVDAVLIDVLLKGIDHVNKMLADLHDKKIIIHQDIEYEDLMEEIEALRKTVREPIGDRLVAAGVLSESEKMRILRIQKNQSFAENFGSIACKTAKASKDDIERAIASPSSGKNPARGDQYIKVKDSQVNYLVDMIGELLIAQNQIQVSDQALLSLRKISKEIQLAALKLRTTDLQPLSSNVQRVIRDTAKKVGKEVMYVCSGADLEVDRGLVEGLGEPLLHLVRNSIHHGIETVELRRKAGKAPAGKIEFSANRKGNTVIVSIRDDGAGLDRRKILDKAVAKQLVSPEAARSMTDQAVWELIFVSGFSTAEKVDQISGRGVGMDIVHTFVKSNRGRITIHTEAGVGTEISLHFPINTAIIDGMIVSVGGCMLVLPVSQVIESINIDSCQLYLVANEVQVVELRGEIMPVICLADYFGFEPKDARQRIGVVVEDNRRKRYVLLVEKLISKREVVIKSLGKRFGKLRAFSAGTVLEGGRIGYILDVDNIIQDSGSQTRLLIGG